MPERRWVAFRRAAALDTGPTGARGSQRGAHAPPPTPGDASAAQSMRAEVLVRDIRRCSTAYATRSTTPASTPTLTPNARPPRC